MRVYIGTEFSLKRVKYNSVYNSNERQLDQQTEGRTDIYTQLINKVMKRKRHYVETTRSLKTYKSRI